MNDNNVALRKQKTCFLLVLTLLFPNYQIHLNVDKIELILVDEKGFEIEKSYLTKNNYEEFKNVIKEIFCLRKGESSVEYNPAGDLSRKIAEKLKERQRILAKQKGEKQDKIAIFSRYVSILAVGQQKDINSLMQYTVYQLFDEYQRFELKMQSDWYLQARLAGAKDLKEVEDWMKDIHSQ